MHYYMHYYVETLGSADLAAPFSKSGEKHFRGFDPFILPSQNLRHRVGRAPFVDVCQMALIKESKCCVLIFCLPALR